MKFYVVVTDAGRHSGTYEPQVSTWEEAVKLGSSYRDMMVSVGHLNAKIEVQSSDGRVQAA